MNTPGWEVDTCSHDKVSGDLNQLHNTYLERKVCAAQRPSFHTSFSVLDFVHWEVYVVGVLRDGAGERAVLLRLRTRVYHHVAF